jgi:hypothetical protein
MQLQDLKPSLTELSTQELVDLIKQIRQIRRENRTVRAAAKVVKTQSEKIDKGLKTMTSAQIEELKKLLVANQNKRGEVEL